MNTIIFGLVKSFCVLCRFASHDLTVVMKWMRWEYVDISEQFCALAYLYLHIYSHICIRRLSKSMFISILYYLCSQAHLSYLNISPYQLYMINTFCVYHGTNRHQLQTRNICYSCQVISSTLKYPLTEFMTTPCRFWWWAAIDHS